MTTAGNFRFERPEPLSGAVLFLIAVFLISYLIPGNIGIGSLTMGFPRLILTLTLIPTTLILLTDPKYQLNKVDALVACYAVWVFISILINNGFSRLEFAGLQVVETFGAYSLGRIMFSTPEYYKYFWRFFGYCTLFILPVGIIELVTERFVLHQLFGPIIDTFKNSTVGYPTRMGFDRVQGNLEHPILFGVFWGFGLLHFLSVFESRSSQIFFMLCCLAAVGISLSSGAYVASMLQLALLAWGTVTKDRWKLLGVLFIILYIVVEVLSDRPAIIAITTRLAFSSNTAYWRVLIFEYGMQNVWANPIFGLGLRDWTRPPWLTPSIDNQWLLTAMRAGIPAFVFQMGAFALAIRMLIKRKDFSPRLKKYRRNYLISFMGTFIALGTVAVWSGTQAFLWVLLAMGTGLALAPGVEAEAEAETKQEDTTATSFQRGGPGGSAVTPYTRPREALGLPPGMHVRAPLEKPTVNRPGVRNRKHKS